MKRVESNAVTQSVKGIIFDLDGTLYRMHWMLRPVMSVKVFPKVLRLPRFIKERKRFAGVDMNCRAELLDEISGAVARAEKCSSEEVHRWIEETFYPSFIDSMSIFRDSRPGLMKTLEKLKKNDIKLAVLSDYDRVRERLEKLRIETDVFDFLTSSEYYGALKPCPRPFLEIAQVWNLQPSQIMVVGDRDDTDGAGAEAAGMQFSKISDNRREADLCWPSLSRYLCALG